MREEVKMVRREGGREGGREGKKFSLCLHLISPTLISSTRYILPAIVYHFAYIKIVSKDTSRLTD